MLRLGSKGVEPAISRRSAKIQPRPRKWISTWYPAYSRNTPPLYWGRGTTIGLYLGSSKETMGKERNSRFLGWERHHQFVIMSAELELAVWDIYGKKHWSTFVEPPWDYKIDGETIHLEVMGKQSIFSLQHGPGHVVQ